MIEWIVIGGAALLMSKKPATDLEVYGPSRDTDQTGGDGPRPFYSTIGGLPDVAPENQGGNYKRDYDDVFYEVGQSYGVPFALLKAHAIKESSIDHRAFRQEPNGKASYGLMQVLWWKNSNRFNSWGFSDDEIGDGSLLYDPEVNVVIACEIILDNYSRLKNLRDSINAYNTGVKESVRVAPYDYVNKVLNYYSTIIGRQIT